MAKLWSDEARRQDRDASRRQRDTDRRRRQAARRDWSQRPVRTLLSRMRGR